MIFVDTNVIIDVLARDPIWYDWSMRQLATAAAEGALLTNAVVTAELTRSFATCEDLLEKLDTLSIRSMPLDVQPAFAAGKVFSTYRSRRDGGERAQVLPDFFIGAHAAMLEMPLLTRDTRLYRAYFPDLTLITPETDA